MYWKSVYCLSSLKSVQSCLVSLQNNYRHVQSWSDMLFFKQSTWRSSWASVKARPKCANCDWASKWWQAHPTKTFHLKKFPKSKRRIKSAYKHNLGTSGLYMWDLGSILTSWTTPSLNPRDCRITLPFSLWMTASPRTLPARFPYTLSSV